jgi:sulfite reductase beta subunit-like hemoprotein
MASSNTEDIKKNSRGLRGQIKETLESSATHFEENEFQLLKFHGSYQQDDRDLRGKRRAEGLDKAWQFMVRSKIPGGDLTAEQYLVHDRMADDLANHTIRFTNRQGIQMHGILFGSLRDCINRINTCGLTTRGACGDIVRNTMACAIPFHDAPHREAQALAKVISRAFYPTTRGYSEIWLDDEKITAEPETEDPIYGEAYLPRKFKIGIAVPPHNDVDVLSHDVGLVAEIESGEIVGYNVFAGGGFGMSFGQMKTRPALGQPLFYVEKRNVIEALKAIVSAQREHGRRDDRKVARLKYVILDRGMDWFREQVFARLSVPVGVSKPVSFGSTEDLLGWHEQGDGKLFCGIWIPEGRVADVEGRKYRSALRALCEDVGVPVRITPNSNVYLYDIDPSLRSWVDGTLKANGIPPAHTLTRARQMSHACVALPTCGLALAESERVFSDLMSRIDVVLRELHLEREPLLFRMSGCPNGCARPYNADFAFVGRSPGKYAVYVGGSYRGDRLVSLATKSVPFEGLTGFVWGILKEFAAERTPGETFSDYWGRTHPQPEVEATQFHLENAPVPA